MPKHDIAIIGAGPGGYVAAIRAAQLGMDVAVIEKEATFGGTCVRVGCIPSKALLESSERFVDATSHLAEHGVNVGDVELDLGTMMERKDAVVKSNTDGVAYLLKKNGVTTYAGRGEIRGTGDVVVHGDDGDVELDVEHIVIATGSSVAGLPGVEFDGDRIGGSTEALAYDEVPERLIVIGGGYIGLELGSVWNRLGSEVTVLEYFDRVLPNMDRDLSKEAKKVFAKQGIAFRLGTKVTGAHVDGDEVVVEVDGDDPLRADRVLVAVGRSPNTAGLGLEAAGVETDDRGFVRVGDGFATNVDGIYAIGDVIGGAMLAHKAEEEGIALVERLATGVGHVGYDTIPGIVYTDPEIATVGKTEQELEDEGIPYAKGEFPYMANGRARALGSTDGKVKILAHAETDRVLGVHIIGAHAGDLIAEAVAAMSFGASSEDIARTMHAHPTLAEVVKEAALAVDGRALHI